PAAEMHVRGLGWIGNRKAEQRLKVLLGSPADILDASAIEDASLVVISKLTEDGYLEPNIRADITLSDGRQVNYPLDAHLTTPLPRPIAASDVILQIDRGRRFVLTDVRFTGLFALKTKNARSFFVGDEPLIHLAAERLYSPSRLQRSIGNLTETLRQQGYAEAIVTADDPQIDHRSGHVSVQVHVQEGRRWVVRELRFNITDGSAAPDKLTANRLGGPWNSLW